MGILEYITENKILILLLIVIFLIGYFYMFPQKVEKMDSNITNININDIVGKDICLRYNKNGDIYYLGVVNNSPSIN